VGQTPMFHCIHVTPLAAESLGVRSMCTFVETPDARILLDAGVSLCPNRFGMPPHPNEFKAIERCRKRIACAAERADIVTVSHYHFDHHTPPYEDWLCNWTEPESTARQVYEGKTVLAKSFKEAINFSQRRRGWMFQQTSGKYAKTIEFADWKSYIFGETSIKFSEPVFHGPENSPLGWVLLSTVEYQDEKLMFAPDIQGPMSVRTLRLIVDEKPQMLIIGGPPSYLAGYKVEDKQIQAGLSNLEQIARTVPLTILEHHTLRDKNWMEKTAMVNRAASTAGHQLLTAAAFLEEEDKCLEAGRKELFAAMPPAKDFKKWMRLGDEAKRRTKPPL